MTTRTEEKLEKRCIRDFYMKHYKDPRFEGLMHMGLEGSIESAFDLHKQNVLLVKVFDINNYGIFIYDKGELTLVYRKGK